MEYIKGIEKKGYMGIAELMEAEEGTSVKTEGMVHSIRRMGEISFIIIRRRDGLIQTVYEEGQADFDIRDMREGDAVRAEGSMKKEERAPHGVEIRLKRADILSHPESPMPLPIDKWKLTSSLEARLDMRPVSLRNVRERARFKIQEGIVRGFREFLYSQGFTEIHTPKIGAKSAEGGANIFKLSYFHKPAVLAQSPQLYKQIMVGVFDRVFETGPVFRAEKHNTKRHLNEYVSLDFEMGYIDGFEDVMAMETALLQHVLKTLEQDYKTELDILKVTLPKADQIPSVRFDEAKKLVSEKYNRPIRAPFDLEPEEEQLIGKYFKEEYGADFVFVTHYPSKKRPFYAMDDESDKRYTLSFDLLLNGMEVTTGGQRIHEYKKLLDKIYEKGMTEEGLETYLDAFKYGMPPHGGLGIGLERLTMNLLGEDNVREVSLFPRDMNRLKP